MILDLIEQRIKSALQPRDLQVTDESHLHVGHQHYHGGGHHFAISIKPQTSSISRLVLHRKIYAALNDLMPNPIHALRIGIIKD